MSHNSILIVGSIALDTIETPVEKRSNVLGGSTTYSLVASGRQSEVSIVGIVGNDFPSEGHSIYKSYASDLSDLKIAEGRTFRWGGRYYENWDDRDTLFTDLGVFSDFRPVLTESNKNRSHILLANIHPELQQSVIQQNQNPNAIVVIDTMNLWIETTLPSLEKVLSASRLPRKQIAIEGCKRASLISPFTNISNPITASIIVRYHLCISFLCLSLLIFRYLLKLCPFVYVKILCLLCLTP